MSKICGKNEISLVCFDNHRKIFFGGGQEAIVDEHFSVKNRMADSMRVCDGVLKKSPMSPDFRMKLYDMLLPFIGKFNLTE